MPEPLGEPIKKVLINIYEADVEEMKALYGWGWTGQVRDLVREHLKEKRRQRDEYYR